MLATRSCMASSAPGKTIAGFPSLDHLVTDALDWSAQVVPLRGGWKILVVAAYFAHGIGFSGQNLARLAQIGTAVKAIGLPFLLLADFNATIGDLQKTGWVYELNAMPFMPKGVTTTCSTGKRVIDFMVGSRILAHLFVDSKPDRGQFGGWSPHLGLIYRFRASPKSVLVKMLQRASRAEPDDVKAAAERLADPEALRTACTLDRGARKVELYPPECLRDSMAFMACGLQSVDLAESSSVGRRTRLFTR